MAEDRNPKEPELSYENAMLDLDAYLGDANAQYILGTRYASGKGFPKNPRLSALWTIRAAKQGHVYAEFLMGLKYESGNGVVQDLVKARKWFQKSHDHGEEMAYEKLLALDARVKT